MDSGVWQAVAFHHRMKLHRMTFSQHHRDLAIAQNQVTKGAAMSDEYPTYEDRLRETEAQVTRAEQEIHAKYRTLPGVTDRELIEAMLERCKGVSGPGKDGDYETGDTVRPTPEGQTQLTVYDGYDWSYTEFTFHPDGSLEGVRSYE